MSDTVVLRTPLTTSLHKMLRETAYEFQSDNTTEILTWWEQTTWALQMHHNLEKDTVQRSDKLCDPKWTSNYRMAKQWVNFGQGAYIRDGKPFIFCLSCKAPLQHPRAFGVGTSHLTTHVKSAKCSSHGALGQLRQTIDDMLHKVSGY